MDVTKWICTIKKKLYKNRTKTDGCHEMNLHNQKKIQYVLCFDCKRFFVHNWFYWFSYLNIDWFYTYYLKSKVFMSITVDIGTLNDFDSKNIFILWIEFGLVHILHRLHPATYAIVIFILIFYVIQYCLQGLLLNIFDS